MDNHVDACSKPPEWGLSSETVGVRYPLSQLFAHAACTYPDRIALSDGRRTYTFGDLELRARRVAYALQQAGVGPASHVAVLTENNAFVPILSAAIWKLGAVYAPVDSKTPARRLQNILHELEPAAILGPTSALEKLPDSRSLLDLAELEQRSTSSAVPEVLEAPLVDETMVAYVIFTSGSTGSPKGVMISHRSLLDYFSAHNAVLQFTERSRVFSVAPYHFDVSIEDTFLPLSLGAYVYRFGGAPVGALLRSLLEREKTTHLIAVSTLLELITEDARDISQARFPDLSMVMTGAEVCPPKVINAWLERFAALRVINAYGPTETTIVCMTYQIHRPEPGRTESYPIGQALRGVHWLLAGPDDTFIRSPGTTGELWIGGSQVMLGYLKRPAETARALTVVDGTLYYRTGDLCRLDERDNLVFVSRMDDEIKLAGRRIHLEEVRQAFLRCAGVDRVAAGLIETASGPAIGAVLVSRADNDVFGALGDALADLPSYMAPRILGRAAAVSLSSSGKADERQLLSALQVALQRQPNCRQFLLLADGTFTPTGDLDRHA